MRAKLYITLIYVFIALYTLTSCLSNKKLMQKAFDRNLIDTATLHKYDTTNILINDTLGLWYKVDSIFTICDTLRLTEPQKTALKRSVKTLVKYIEKPVLTFPKGEFKTIDSCGNKITLKFVGNKLVFKSICKSSRLNLCPEKNWYERNQKNIDLFLLLVIIALLLRLYFK